MSQILVTGEAKIRDIQGPVVANSGVITALDGDASQYVRGDGTLADFPTSTGGGSSVSYYLNSSISQGTIGGVAYRQLGKTPISGAGTDIAISANGYVASYITDANDPALLEVPAGNFNCEFYFSVNNNTGNPFVYAEVYKYDGTTFTLIGTSVGVPEYINQGTVINPYYFAVPVAQSVLTVTDRISIRIYVNVDGRTVTLHTENNHLCQVVTTFSKGLISLNNLTRQNQFFATGTSGTDFGISSSVATHTFNLPVASATNTGKLSSTDWSTFNNKQNALTNPITGLGASGNVAYFDGTTSITSENSFNYDATLNRLGVNTTVPNATIGANAGTDSGYSLLLKNDNANYNGIGFATSSTYGNVIGTEKLGTAPARNLTLLNQSGYISITEVGNLGVNILNPNTGLDIYNGTSAYLWLHTANSGITGTDGVRLALFSNNGANLRNFEGAMSITSEGDFQVITLGAENIRVNSVDGKVGIGAPATVPEMLTVNGSIQQSGVLSSLLKTNGDGKLIAAVAGTDYVAPSGLSAYVPYTGATTNVNLGTHSLSAYDLVINHASGSGVAASITKGGSGEALTVVKTSGSGNAASITGGVTLLSELHLTTDLADAYIASAATWNAKMSGSGSDGRVAFYNGTNSVTSEAGFIYDSSTNRLGVNTSVPNATIGADAALNSGYGLLIKTGASNYNGIGIAIDSTYGNTIEAARLGSAPSRNLTLLNVTGYVSLTETGSFGVGILNPNNGIDIYNSTQSQLWLHNAATGITATDGVRLALFNSKEANLRNFDGGLSITAEGDFSIITIGAENFRINSANGFVGIGNPTTLTSILTVNGAITQTSVTSALLKTNASGTIVAAVAGTDYLAGSVISGTTDYIPRFTSSTTIGNSDISQDATFVILNSKALSAPRARFNTAYDNASLTLNVAGQTYMDSRTSRLYNTFNLSSMTNYMHIYDPYSTTNANGGFSIGASTSITLLPSTSIIHFDGVNNRVGVGTTAPTRTFSVTGTSYFNGTFTLAGGAGFNYDSLRFAYSNGTSSNNIYSGGADGLNISNQADTEILMRVLNNGNVAIGGTNPDYGSFGAGERILGIRNVSARGRLQFQNTSTGTSGVSGTLAFFNGSTQLASIDVIADGATNKGRYVFNTNDGTSNTARMYILNTGDVGIGTSNPSTKLQVEDGYISTYHNINLNGGGYGILFYTNGGGSKNTIASIDISQVGTARSGDMIFNTSNSGAPSPRMRINSGGNVLIGSSSEQGNWKAQVTGNMFIRGSVANSSATALYIDNSSGATLLSVRNDGLINLGTAEYSPFNYGTTGRTPILQSNGLFGYLSSTRESKTNIEQLSDVSWLYQLNPVSFNYRKKDDEMNYTEEAQDEKWYGLIADEVESVNEDLVFYNTKEDGTKQLAGVEYNKIIAALIKSSQEQQAQIEELKALINK